MVFRHFIGPGLACVVGLATVVSVRADSARPVAPAQASAITSRVRGFEDTQAWFRHVHNHQVWQSDAAAAAVAKLPLPVLQGVATDLRIVRLLLDTAASTGQSSVDATNRRLSTKQLAALLGLTVDELDLPLDLTDLSKPDNPARKTISRLMMRAAILHTAIAVSPAEETAPPPGAAAGQKSSMGRGADGLRPAGSGASKPVILAQDGRQVGLANFSVHWAIARAALDLIGPPPSGSSTVRLWYHATSARMQIPRDYAALEPHLDHARAVLPSDAHTFLLSGVMYENLAAPPVQSVLAEVSPGFVSLAAPADSAGRGRALSAARAGTGSGLGPDAASFWPRAAGEGAPRRRCGATAAG